MSSPRTYKDAGVDIEAGDRFVDDIRPLVESTMRPEVESGLGGFSGLCRIPEGYREPVLVSGTDGVGSKLEVAFATGRHQTVGVDLVAMAVNDVIVCGAEPLFFLDYLAIGKLDPVVARDVLVGIADGCRQAGCALLGGETAELPGFYQGARYDLAGFCVGVVERSEIRDGRDVQVGDVIVGLPSSGLHANGHSLARAVLLDRFALDDTPAALGGASVADALLRPTLIYASALAYLRTSGIGFKAAAHITGGGLVNNPPRMLRDAGLGIQLDLETWQVPPVFTLIAQAGVDEHEMRRTFNMGIGMMVVLGPKQAQRALAEWPAQLFASPQLAPRIIGRVTERGRANADQANDTQTNDTQTNDALGPVVGF